ncbi:hypothetical protein CYMTET_10947, partial [Cymbomonas tetramitiformis]
GRAECPRGEPRAVYTEQLTLYISGLAFDTDEAELQAHINQCGAVKEVRLIRNRDTGQSKGYAYVQLEDEETMRKAMKLSGKELRGRKISIAKSKPKVERGGHGGGGHDGGGHGGGKGKGKSSTDTGKGGKGKNGSGKGKGKGKGGGKEGGQSGKGKGKGGAAAAKGGGSAGGGDSAKDATAARPSMRPAVAFVPRSVKQPPATADSAAASSVEAAKPKSNDDFRKLLLKK